MTLLLDSSTSGAPVVAIRPSLTLRYGPWTFWKVMESWAHYHETGRAPLATWEEMSIQQMLDLGEADFCGVVEVYADFEIQRGALAANEAEAVRLYWIAGLRRVKAVAKEMGRAEELARTWVWDGTERMCQNLCGLTPAEAHAEARLWRERAHVKWRG